MFEIQFLRLNEKWAVAYDNLQWILQKRRGFDHRRQQWNWQNVAFVAFSKDVLLRVIREKRVAVTAQAQPVLDALPATFPEFIRHPRRFLVTTLEPMDTPGETTAMTKEALPVSGSSSGSLEVIVGGRTDPEASKVLPEERSVDTQARRAAGGGGGQR